MIGNNKRNIKQMQEIYQIENKRWLKIIQKYITNNKICNKNMIRNNVIKYLLNQISIFT